MNGSRVIVVEDEPDIRRMLEFYLESEGFDVEGIGNGGDAMERLNGEPPDAMILDIMLPHHDGLEILHVLRSTEGWEKVPVLMLTAKSGEKDVVRAFDAGADDYVTKPFQLDSLVARLHRLLAR